MYNLLRNHQIVSCSLPLASRLASALTFLCLSSYLSNQDLNKMQPSSPELERPTSHL